MAIADANALHGALAREALMRGQTVVLRIASSSMGPLYPRGCALQAVRLEPRELRAGDLIVRHAVRLGQEVLVVHRLLHDVTAATTHLRTRGDALLAADDPWPVSSYVAVATHRLLGGAAFSLRARWWRRVERRFLSAVRAGAMWRSVRGRVLHRVLRRVPAGLRQGVKKILIRDRTE